MDETYENGMELFCQDGVLLKTASASFIQYVNTSGTLSIVEYLNSNQTRFIEWKPNDITIDSEVQDQEWAVVNTVERRTRTLSGSSPPDGIAKKIVRINMKDIKSFRVTRFNQKLSFNDALRKPICTFVFQHGNADCLVAALKGGLLPVAPSREKNVYIVVEHPEITRLNKSFAELNLFPEQGTYYVWRFFKNLQNRPYETTMEAFSKLTDIIYRGPEMTQRLNEAEVEDLLTQSLTQLEEADGARVADPQDEYELVDQELAARPIVHRGSPLTTTKWYGLMDAEGRILDVEGVKMLIFRGGVEPVLRSEVWKFLLDYYPWDSTREQRAQLDERLRDEYSKIKIQWTNITAKQEQNHSEYRERKSLVEKDVNRTDRTDLYYAGDDNEHVGTLSDVLMSYVMYNFDLGYVQGMSDLASPLLCLLDDEIETFWCFAAFMERVGPNFEEDQAEIKEQLCALHELLKLFEPQMATYLRQHDSGNMFFCFRWLLVWFKREFSRDDVRSLWEALWTGLPCRNFQLLVAVAILLRERTGIEAQRSFAGILKHVNELSQRIDLRETLCCAEALYHQIVASAAVSDSVCTTLGLTPRATRDEEPSEASFERALDLSYI